MGDVRGADDPDDGGEGATQDLFQDRGHLKKGITPACAGARWVTISSR